MTVTEGLMRVGSWNLKLDNAPIEMRREFDWFGNIVITAARINDTNIDRDTLLDAAKYSGIIAKRNIGEGSFGGFGLAGYMQTGRGHAGAIGLYSPTWPATFGQILTAWMTGDQKSNGLTLGSITGAAGPQVQSMEAGTYWPPLKPMLDQAAAQTFNEYIVRPDGSVDWGFNQLLFPTFTTPTVLLSPEHRGTDNVAALELTRWSVDQDLMDYRNFAFAKSQNGLTELVNVSSAGSLTVYGWGGPSVAGQIRYLDRITVNTNNATDVSDAAVAAAAEYAEVNYRIECSVDEFCIPRLVTPGDWVWVHDPDNDLTGGSEVVHFGRSVFPEKVRCHGYTWPIQSGMGVYVINNQTQDITDVSDFVSWETGSTRLELGSPQRRLNTTVTVSKFR